jgi:hypothetical protein
MALKHQFPVIWHGVNSHCLLGHELYYDFYFIIFHVRKNPCKDIKVDTVVADSN